LGILPTPFFNHFYYTATKGGCQAEAAYWVLWCYGERVVKGEGGIPNERYPPGSMSPKEQDGISPSGLKGQVTVAVGRVDDLYIW